MGESGSPGCLRALLARCYQTISPGLHHILDLVAFLIWLFYYLNVQIITDRRIVDIDQVGLFHHEVSELHIENIEDVTSEVSGVLGTVFNYGDVYVQTAASIERFEFSDVPNPGSINKLIPDPYEKIPPEQRTNAHHN